MKENIIQPCEEGKNTSLGSWSLCCERSVGIKKPVKKKRNFK